MRDLSLRIERLTQELRELRLQLQWTNSQAAGHGERSRVLNDVLSASLVPDLSEVVDQLTQFLWRYIDSAAKPAPGADYAQQSEHLNQATELLRRLRCASSSRPSEHPAAFVTRVTRAVDRLLESGGQPQPGVREEPLRLERLA